MPKVLIVNGGFGFRGMFASFGYTGATSIEEADLVCFTGGEDVTPELYGEKNLIHGGRTVSFTNPKRDAEETEIYHKAKELGIPMVGICRGGQFLNVMNGGRLWQHVDNHTRPHVLIDCVTNEEVNVTSTHHQMMRPTKDGLIVAIARESLSKMCDGQYWSIHQADDHPIEDFDDIEAVWYEETRCLCFQPHPEYDNLDCRQYFKTLLERFFN